MRRPKGHESSSLSLSAIIGSAHVSWFFGSSQFSILFGLILAWGCFEDVRTGWVQYNLLPDHFHFTYPGFGWVTPLPGNGMVYLTLGLGVLALFVAAGVYWRVAGSLF